MRLTRRGEIVLFIAACLVGGTIGYLTADWCWYGYCGP